MALIFNHKKMAANANRNLSRLYSTPTTVGGLSSGFCVGQASDNAYSPTVKERIQEDNTAINQGSYKAEEAISLLKAANDALGVIGKKLLTMKELAKQVAAGMYTSEQLPVAESEYQRMASDITRVASTACFNGIHLLNGDLSEDSYVGNSLSPPGKLTVHLGPGNALAEEYYIHIDAVTASALGVGNQSAISSKAYTVSTQQAAQNAVIGLKKAIASKDTIRASLGAMQSHIEKAVSRQKVTAENKQAAESRISDVDVSLEMTNFVHNQILSQKAVAMLSQASYLPQMALRLAMT